jgi:hypothetical protein
MVNEVQHIRISLKKRPIEYESIKKELEKGTPVYKIEKKYKVSNTTIRRHFGKRKSKRNALSNNEIAEIMALHKLGVKKGIIAKKYNIYYNLLSQIIKDNTTP